MRKILAKFIQQNSNGDHEVTIFETRKGEQIAECTCQECGDGVQFSEGRLAYIAADRRLCLRPDLKLAKVRKFCSPACARAHAKRTRAERREANPRVVENAELFV